MNGDVQHVEATGGAHELGHLQKEWKWFFILGLALIFLGTIALGSCYFVTMVTVVMFGVLILMGGIAQVISAFWAGKWSGFLLHLLIGILYIIAGFIIVDAPDKSAALLTLVMAAFFFVSGIFRIVTALSLRIPGWGWVLLNGIVTLLLGILIYKGWPATGESIIGLFVGIELIFNGWYWVMMGLGLKNAGEGESAAA